MLHTKPTAIEPLYLSPYRMKLCKPVLECGKARKQMKRDQGKMVSRGPGPSDDLCAKYENYFEYKNLAWNTKPHSVSCVLSNVYVFIVDFIFNESFFMNLI